jgi:hypothetical protein
MHLRCGQKNILRILGRCVHSIALPNTEFWQEQGDEAIFAASWEMVELAEEVRYGRKPTFQRTATTLKRLSQQKMLQPPNVLEHSLENEGIPFKRPKRRIAVIPDHQLKSRPDETLSCTALKRDGARGS